jgi:AcrR family transcriptional regulator
MNVDQRKRSYVMTARAEKMARTEERIMRAAVSLWKEKNLRDITLEMIAENAGVTVRTLLRKYGSKDGVIQASIESEAAGAAVTRIPQVSSELGELISSLLSEYETMGDAVIRTIYLSDEIPVASSILARGRAIHREWCEKSFGQYLCAPDPAERELRLSSIIAATEIYLWKLLRRDMGKSREETHRIFRNMVEGLILGFDQNNEYGHK